MDMEEEGEGQYFTKFNDAFFVVNPIFKYLDEDRIVPYEDNKSFSGEMQDDYLNYDMDMIDIAHNKRTKPMIGMMEHIFGKYNYIRYGSYYLVNSNAEKKLDKVYDAMLGSSYNQMPSKLAFHIVTKIKGDYDNYPDSTDQKQNMKGIINRAIDNDYNDYINNKEERSNFYSKLFHQRGGRSTLRKHKRITRRKNKKSNNRMRKTKQSKSKNRKYKNRKSKQSK